MAETRSSGVIVLPEVVVAQLRPGDIVTGHSQAGVVVQTCPHPIYPGLTLVIWRMKDGTWSHDALSPAQVVGDAGRDDDWDITRKRVQDALSAKGWSR